MFAINTKLSMLSAWLFPIAEKVAFNVIWFGNYWFKDRMLWDFKILTVMPKVKWCMNKSQFKDPLTNTFHVSSVGWGLEPVNTRLSHTRGNFFLAWKDFDATLSTFTFVLIWKILKKGKKSFKIKRNLGFVSKIFTKTA